MRVFLLAFIFLAHVSSLANDEKENFYDQAYKLGRQLAFETRQIRVARDHESRRALTSSTALELVESSKHSVEELVDLEKTVNPSFYSLTIKEELAISTFISIWPMALGLIEHVKFGNSLVIPAIVTTSLYIFTLGSSRGHATYLKLRARFRKRKLIKAFKRGLIEGNADWEILEELTGVQLDSCQKLLTSGQ